jgi:hypothetical protein
MSEPEVQVAGSTSLPSARQKNYPQLMRSLPGETANPQGNNQYTYKHRFENSIDRLLNGDIDERHLELIPQCARPFLADIPKDMEVGDVLAIVTLTQALSGDGKALSEALSRIWPATQKHEIDGDRAVVIVRDYSGGRDGREPQEVGAITVEAGSAGTYSAEACETEAPTSAPGDGETTR